MNDDTAEFLYHIGYGHACDFCFNAATRKYVSTFRLEIILYYCEECAGRYKDDYPSVIGAAKPI